MDRVLNPRDEKQTIYEIYRACRLCGAGAGYKMPIIQNVVDLDGDGVELRQKIKECVQIEVNHTDRMPPLICELCVDKVNDFYVFLDMCKQNNRRTRLRLGLPLQTRTRDLIDSENCILGVTEPMFIDSDGEPLTRHKNKNTRIKKELVDVKIKTDKGTTITEPVSFSSEETEPLAKRKIKKIRITKEFEVQSKVESRPSPKPEQKPSQQYRESRESSAEPRWASMSRKKRAPSPPKRTTRQTADAPAPIIHQLTETPKTVKIILKKTDDLLIERKLKRPRERETKIDTPPPPPKKIKMTPEPVKLPKPGPKSSKVIQKEPPKISPKPAKPASKKDLKPSPPSKTTSKPLPSKPLPSKPLPSKALPSKALPSKALPSKATLLPEAPKAFYCQICNLQTKTSQGFAQHNTKHVPNFTSPKHACNACELWFSTVEETSIHHRNHRNQSIPYKCTRCYGYFKLQQAYEDHFGDQLCLSVYEVPDVKCWECWKLFPTNKLMEDHKCPGEDGRPGGKCIKCKRTYSLLKNLIRHESNCTHKRKGDVKVDPKIQARLLPMQVRITRCDPLIKHKERVDSSKVSHSYGLDSKYQYPYLTSVQVKPEPKPFNPMVSIDESVKEEFCDSFIHWDSDNSDSETGSVDTDSSQKKVDSLSTISLKTIFSKKGIDKVPKKKRNVKSEAFDSVSVDLDLVMKIGNIIDNLDNEDAQTTCSNDSDSILDKGVANSSENQVKSDSKNVSPIIKDSKTSSNNSDSILDKIESDKTAEVEDRKINDDAFDKLNETSYKQNKTSVMREEKSEEDDASEKVDDITLNQDNTSEKPNDISEKLEDTFENLDDTSEKLDDTHDELEMEKFSGDSIKETVNIENVDRESVKERDDSKSIEKVISDDVKQNENHDLTRETDGEITKNHDETDDRKELETINSETKLTNEKDLKNGKLVSNNQFESLKSENNCKVSVIESNDSDKMEVDHDLTENDTVKHSVSHDSDEIEKPAENNENFSKINEITNEILKNQASLSKHDNDIHKSDPNSDSISLNSVRSENGVENQDRFNVNDLSEDDRMLMAELDAQIGENDQKSTENNQKFTENNQKFTENNQKFTENYQKYNENDQKSEVQETKQHSIDDLLKKQDSDLRSLDLDSISDDEFNFDV